jgi:DNA-binding response OmpR family regulator
MQILLVEDDKNYGRILKLELEEEDHQVDLANDGVEGVLSFLGGLFDIVLLDIRMPRLNGIDTLRIIKRLDPAVPVIVYSANASPRDRAEAMAAGACACLSKPFTFDRLNQIMHDLAREKSHAIHRES